MKKIILQIILTIGIITFFLMILNQIYILSMEGLAKEYTKRQLILTKQAAVGIDGYFNNLKQTMDLAASIPELKEQKLKEKHFAQRIYSSFEMLKKQGVKNLLITDKNGICKWQAEGNNFFGFDLSNTTFFKASKILKPSEFYISGLSKKNTLSSENINEIIINTPIYCPSVNKKSPEETFSG